MLPGFFTFFFLLNDHYTSGIALNYFSFLRLLISSSSNRNGANVTRFRRTLFFFGGGGVDLVFIYEKWIESIGAN